MNLKNLIVHKKKKLSGWGNYPKKNTNLYYPKNDQDLINIIKLGKCIARGNGRSYGDSSIGETNTISMKNFNKILHFNKKNGMIIVESGVLLKNILEKCIEYGWFTKVSPGTKYVTVGGMVASDVHGKNHYNEGSFRNCIEWFELINEKGEKLMCSKNSNQETFNWTIGGMGLTGVITKIAFFLKSIETSWVKNKIVITRNINETIDIFEQNLQATYAVAWVDSFAKKEKLGRSVVSFGEHANLKDLKNNKKKNNLIFEKDKNYKIKFYFPKIIINKFFMQLFNFLYYKINSLNSGFKIVNLNSFFYPLDGIKNWNKIYGNNGFAQLQFVIPIKNSRVAIHQILNKVSEIGSPLAVIKRFGKEDGFFSFPIEGYTLSLDFKINRNNLNLMNELDQIVLKYKGRFYLTKDSRLSSHKINRSNNNYNCFKKFIYASKNEIKFSSMQSKRINL